MKGGIIYMEFSFYKWLMFFKDVATPVGSLADEVSKDTEFPKRSSDFEKIMDHLVTSSPGNHELYQCFENSYSMYLLETKKAVYTDGKLTIYQ